MHIKNSLWDGNSFALGAPDLAGMSKWGRYWYNKRARKSLYMKDPPKTFKFDKEIYARTGKIVRLEDDK